MFKLHTLRELTNNIRIVLAKITFKFHFLDKNQADGRRFDFKKEVIDE